MEEEDVEEDEQTSKGEENRLTLIINPGNRVKKMRVDGLKSVDWRLETGGYTRIESKVKSVVPPVVLG